MIQMCNYGWSYLIPGYFPRFLENANSIVEVKNNYTNYDSSWNSCPDSYQLFENSLPVYQRINNTVTVEFVTMLQFLDQLITRVNYI